MGNRTIALVTTGVLTAGLLTAAHSAGGLGAASSAQALTADQATSAYTAFVDTYWDPTAKYFYTYSDHQIHPEHATGPQGGLYTDYWWEAQLWEAVLDRYERTGDASSRQMIDDVFDGFQAAYPDFRDNDWNDDMGWWARGSIRAYELTGEQRFLDESKEIFAYISQYEDTTYGGGIWWKNVDVGDGTRNEKNVATNATAVYTALRLYAATGDTAYRVTAERLFGWLQANFYQGGDVRDHISGTGQWSDFDWTYNNGDYAGAALQMYLITNDPVYLAEATTVTDWAIANLTSSGTFLNEGVNDPEGFKAILTRNIRDLIDEGGQTQYEAVLTANASQAANHVSPEGIGGADWAAPTPSISEEPRQSLGAAASVAIQQQAQPNGSTSVVEGSGVYEAENVDHAGISTEASHSDYTGRGYLAGWNADATAATFHVNVEQAGAHSVTLRYAAAAGTATRAIGVNDGAPSNVTFPETTSWDQWKTITVSGNFDAGSNTIVLADTTATGSSNFLNLDSLTITR